MTTDFLLDTLQNNKGVAYAVSTADTAKDAADITTLATDNLVATNSGTSANPIWVLQGDGSNTTQNNKGVAYAVDTAETAKDTFAVPAKDAGFNGLKRGIPVGVGIKNGILDSLNFADAID